MDPRVGETLERMNNAGDDVNNKELELTKAKRALQRIPDEERKKCQVRVARFRAQRVRASWPRGAARPPSFRAEQICRDVAWAGPYRR